MGSKDVEVGLLQATSCNTAATTDLYGKCTTTHSGTSAAAPEAAGVFALALEAKFLKSLLRVLRIQLAKWILKQSTSSNVHYIAAQHPCSAKADLELSLAPACHRLAFAARRGVQPSSTAIMHCNGSDFVNAVRLEDAAARRRRLRLDCSKTSRDANANQTPANAGRRNETALKHGNATASRHCQTSQRAATSERRNEIAPLPDLIGPICYTGF
ncbi:unnamed protein product [Brassicogethes aeneus]|uniref:Peptidase S8/S53 domain-containing protein n=1 Tax=Brassicogethes aeneus TaxID=1431903 RepID=A0A9P0AYI3_BRAAE|nr:unnamed protein product [Brassicogethes aeneus]